MIKVINVKFILLQASDDDDDDDEGEEEDVCFVCFDLFYGIIDPELKDGSSSC